MQRPYRFLPLAATLLILAFGTPASARGPSGPTAAELAVPAPPRLVLAIVVDQLRGDLPFRYRGRLQGGLRYLMDQGTWYASAYHPHAHTETIVGHTTLVTGAYPSRHGMVGNTWYDAHTGEKVNSVEDPDFPLIDCRSPDAGRGAEATRTCEEKCPGGASPRRILTTTIGDELTVATNQAAKSFAVAAKSRAAVSLAGHTGQAFWFSKSSGNFVSSSFYGESYPQWVKAWNDARPADRYAAPTKWKLSEPRAEYLFRDVKNDYPAGTPPEDAMTLLESTFSYGRTFPHTFAPAQACQGLYTGLTLSPFSDVLTVDFAKALIREEGLGADETTDYLGIGLSATDIIAHWFSPASLESEENLLQLDRTLADLFSFVDHKIGLDNTLIFLAGDHGGPEFPEYLEKLKIDSGRVSKQEILSRGRQALKERSWPEELIRTFAYPYFYLDSQVVAESKLDQEAIERVIARSVMELEGVDLAVSSRALRAGGEETDKKLIEQIRRNHHPERSGNVYVVQRPQWQIQQEPASGEGGVPGIELLQHGSPWAYDTYVPIVFAGAGIPAAMVYRKVSTVDVAPTVAAYLGTKVPSGSVGAPLVEVLDSK